MQCWPRGPNSTWPKLLTSSFLHFMSFLTRYWFVQRWKLAIIRVKWSKFCPSTRHMLIFHSHFWPLGPINSTLTQFMTLWANQTWPNLTWPDPTQNKYNYIFTYFIVPSLNCLFWPGIGLSKGLLSWKLVIIRAKMVKVLPKPITSAKISPKFLTLRANQFCPDPILDLMGQT